MRFIHIADVHLGAEPAGGSAYSEKRKNEIWEGFRNAVELCRSRHAELLLIAGDLFHRQPLLRELKEADHLLGSIPETQVVLIAGNHDYIKKNSFYRSFVWSPNVHMLREETMTHVELSGLDTAVYGLSYHTRENPEPLYERVRLEDPCRYHILLAHGGDARHLPFRKEVVNGLGFDYVALGHIHKPGVLIPDRMAYAGAPEPVDVNDTGRHGVICGELMDKGARISFLPTAKREYIHAEIPVERDMTGFALRERIEELIRQGGTENLYRLTLTGQRDPEVQFDLAGMDPYGNILEIADHTEPAYDYGKLLRANRENLLGRYIASFAQAEPGSEEQEALYEGVRALLDTKRGQL